MTRLSFCAPSHIQCHSLISYPKSSTGDCPARSRTCGREPRLSWPRAGPWATGGPDWAGGHPSAHSGWIPHPMSPTVTAPSGILDVTVVYLSPEQHCCQESSDEEACPEDRGHQDPRTWVPGPQMPPTPEPEPQLCGTRKPGRDSVTSGYSSISSASPTNSVDGVSGGPPQSTSVPSPGSDLNTQFCHHHAKKSCLQCRSPGPLESSVPQVKRKSLCTHSEEEEEGDVSQAC